MSAGHVRALNRKFCIVSRGTPRARALRGI